jgi:hypothetical protein
MKRSITISMAATGNARMPDTSGTPNSRRTKEVAISDDDVEVDPSSKIRGASPATIMSIPGSIVI